jgi:hypothetical protein
MLSPGGPAGIPVVPPFARITYEPVGFIERKRLAATENPHPALLLQRRAATYRLQGDALAFGLEGKGVSGFKAQLVPDLLGNDNAAGFVDGDSRSHSTNNNKLFYSTWYKKSVRSGSFGSLGMEVVSRSWWKK